MVERTRHNLDNEIEFAPLIQRNIKLMLKDPESFLKIAMTSDAS